MSRLVAISPAPVRGGAEEYSLTIARSARERGWDVHMALPVTPGTATLRADLREARVSMTDLCCADFYGPDVLEAKAAQARAASQVAVMLARLRPDVVHLTLPWPSLGLGAQLAASVMHVPMVIVFQLISDPVSLGARPSVYRFMRHRRQA